MYGGAAAIQNFRPSDGERFHRFSSDQGGDPYIMINLLNTASLSEYDLGGGDLFNAPEPIIEEPLLEIDPVTAAMCMMSSGQDVIAAEAMKVVDMDSMQNEHPLSEAFYDCKKDLLEKSAINESFPVKEDTSMEKNKFVAEGPLQKSVSSGCLKSIDWTNNCSVKENFGGFQELDLEEAFGIRRAYSEGDIHTVGNGGSSLGDKITVNSSFEQLKIDDLKNESKSEERKEKINRYRRKKSRRNFGRKIKELFNLHDFWNFLNGIGDAEQEEEGEEIMTIFVIDTSSRTKKRSMK